MELNSIFAKYFKPASYDSSKVNIELCKKCGGNCCNGMGCHICPSDLKEISVESIISLINETGCISIDWWHGNPITDEATNENTYYLRIKNSKAKVIDPSFRGICSILTDNGCPLSFEYRPKGGRELVPHETKCYTNYSKQQSAADWYEHQDVLKEVYEYFMDKKDYSEIDVWDAQIAMMLNAIEALQKAGLIKAEDDGFTKITGDKNE